MNNSVLMTAEQFDIKAAIVEYKRFLALKIIHKDDTSKKFAPSPDVDKIWHLHLVFPEQYQQDVLAFAKELKVKPRRGSSDKRPLIIPHCPFLMEESKERYEETLARIRDKQLETIVKKKADMKFWPAVEELFPYEEDSEEDTGFGGCCQIERENRDY